MPKYKNREYGFPGRPPFFPEFTEESERPEGAEEGKYPGRTRVGFGLDPKYPAAALLAGNYGSLWTVTVEVRKKGKFAPVGDLTELPAEKFYLSRGARTMFSELPEGSLGFAAKDDGSVILSFRPKKKLKFRVLARPVGSAVSSVQSEKDLVKGRAFARGVIPGQIELGDEGARIRNRFTATRSDGDKKDYFSLKSYSAPSRSDVTADSVAYGFDALPGETFLFFASVGEKIETLDVPEKRRAEAYLGEASEEAKRAEEGGTGLAEGRLRALKELRKHLAYDPYLMSPVLSEDKRADDGYFGYDGLERAVGAILAAYAEEPEAAETMALSAASEPAFGAVAVAVVFRHTKNKEFLKAALPRMMEAWDTTDKLAVADPKTKRELCYRQTGSPLKEELFRKGAAYSVDMSSYKLLAFRAIAALLGELGVDASDYRERAEGLKRNMNELLYREELGIYMNRHVTGEWAVGYGFTSFLPLLAGAVTDGERLNELYRALKNPKKFWDGALFPTISKDSFFYGRRNPGADGGKAQKYENYTGMISPWANLLMYAAARASGMFEISEEIAASSFRTFQKAYAQGGEYPSFYRPDLLRSASDRRRSLTALVMPFLGSWELLDYDYGEEGAFRFGTTRAGEHSVRDVPIGGKRMTFRKDDAAASLYADGQEIFRGEPGNFEVRGFTETSDAIRFFVRTETAMKLTLKTPVFLSGEFRKLAFRIEGGKHAVTVKDGKVRVKTVSL